MVYMWELTWII